jgi:PAS domain S-box-containing protein
MKPMNVLVVEDQPINRKLLVAQLEAEGHTLFEAADGVQALAVLETAPVEVVISDILMPVMDGYRLCGEIRRSPSFGHLPFIFYTATYTSPADEQLCRELGADAYLRKPLAIQELLKAIENAVVAPRPKAVRVQEQDILKEYSERLIFKLEQKNAELAAVSGQLALQAAALDISADAVVITDFDGKVSWVNRAFAAVIGRSSQDVIGMTVGVFDAGLQEAVFHRSFWESHPGPVWRGEAATPRAAAHYDVTVTPVRAKEGTITHFVGVMHDVSEREKAEEQLRATHEQLRQLLEHSSAVIFAFSVEGTTPTPRFASENITRLFGFTPEEVLHSHWWATNVHPEDIERATGNLVLATVSGASRNEYRLRHKDGSYRWVDDSLTLVREGREAPTELVGVLTDITERRRAQEELRESERRFRGMLTNLHLIAMMLDRSGRITYCNDHLLRLTGWTSEEVIGRDWFETFVGADAQRSQHGTFESLITNSPEAWHDDSEILTRAGKRLLIRWNNTVLRSSNGEVTGTASIGEDITERKNLEAQFLRTQRLESLGTLAGGIAHDLNNVLMPILMGVALLKRLGPSERSLKTIDSIERSVKRGSELVRQVLLFARGAESSRATVRLGTVIREVEGIAQSTFPKDIAFHVSTAENLRVVIGDVTQLTQVLLNLCVNARDAMPHGGEIFITASNADLTQHYVEMHGGQVDGPYVILEVMDTGEGMAQETMDRIFDPFFTTKPVGKGTGLGLSTVQGIVSSHGGFVNVHSTIGEGSTFRVHLPARNSDSAQAAVIDEDVTRVPLGNNELIMVVDDDSTILSITRETLEAFGYRVVTAEDGAQAIGLFARLRDEVALVLTDMAMPILDGHALIAALTRIDPEVPIIVATGSTTSAQMTKIARTSVTRVLAKPYTADHLARTISDVLSAKKP